MQNSFTSKELRERFLEFFKKKDHAVVKSSSLIPDDPSVLLTTAGVQQFKSYYTGESDPIKDFGSRNTVSIQKSFRTSDIDEVGDESHLTFFEMLGNFSFGGYFKNEAIEYGFEFITKDMNLPISYVTIFKGSNIVPNDIESRTIWESLGVKDVREQGLEDVFWGPTGISGPCGPTTEIYCKNAKGQDIEIWNIVFNEYFCNSSREDLIAGKAELTELPFKGIDTGMGLERLAMIVQKAETIFETDLFLLLISLLPQGMDVRIKRIVADHSRAAAFLISDGIKPSNKEAGYVLRRLLRRVAVYEYLSRTDLRIKSVLKAVVEDYKDFYPELNKEVIFEEFEEEFQRFKLTLAKGIKELEKISNIDAKIAFWLYQTLGLPYEIIKELGGSNARSLSREDFEKEFEKHQEISRAGFEKKFGGHGLILNTGELKAATKDEVEKVTRLHTATHLLHQALRDVLGSSVHQMGSDITIERTRFDFNFNRKLSLDEVRKIENIVNGKINEELEVVFKEMPKERAIQEGALAFFKHKYPDIVKVYFIVNYSKELCGGPHVKNTKEIGFFKILKEEAIGQGIRRIRADVN